MINNNEYFIQKSFYGYLVPSILSILGGNISIMIDNCVAGAILGEHALAAMSVVNPMFNILTAFGLLISGGASTLASISIGSNDVVKKQTYFTLAAYLTLIIGAACTVVGLFALDPIIIALGAQGELFPLARDYCMVMIGGGVVLMLVYLPLNFFRIEGMGQVGMIMFFIMSALDIALDLLFVSVFDFGMAGLALATILSSAIAVAVVFPRLLSERLGYRFVRLKAPLADIKRMLSKGSPLAMGNVYTMIRVRVLNGLLMSCGGSLALASFACANNINIIGMAFVTGIAQTVAPLVGVLYGERDGAGIKQVAKKAVVIGVVVTAGIGLLAALFSKQLSLLFGMASPQQLASAQSAIVILSTNLIFVLLSSVFIYSYMTCDHTALANVLTLGKGLVFTLLFAFVGAALLGTTGTLLGLVLGEGITVVLALVLALILRHRNRDYKGLLLLSRKRFDGGSTLTCSVLNIPESISEAANQCSDFCGEQGMSPKQTMTVGLGVEEIMVLMSKYALSQPKELMELRLLISPLETIVRIRCGGKWFNPLSFEADDDFDNMGIKILVNMASDLSYSTNLGMNNIRITI